MSDSHGHTLQSKAVHAGIKPNEHRAVTPPIYQTSTFAFDSADQGADLFAGRQPGYISSRMLNPTVQGMEDAIAALEGGTAGLACGSEYFLIEQDDPYGRDVYDCLIISRDNLIEQCASGVDVTANSSGVPALLFAMNSQRDRVLACDDGVSLSGNAGGAVAWLSGLICLSSNVGLDVNTASSDYIQLYDGDKKTLMQSLERIQRTAGEILEAIADDEPCVNAAGRSAGVAAA